MSAAVDRYLNEMFSLEGQVAIVTGGTGVLGGAMARALARAGAQVAIVGRRVERAETVAREISDAGGVALAAPGDVLERADMERVRDAALAQWGRIDILVNAAGGTTPEATVAPDKTIFDMALEPMEWVVRLNLYGTVLPSQVFGEVMARQRSGSIVNISSMTAQRATTRAVAYSASKAAIDNFTRWLAIELTLKFGPGLRVNAIAPGYFLGEQNRHLLVNPDGTPTERGQKIIEHTPVGRFGEPEEVVGTLIWLCSPAAGFVNGTVTMVDGGVNAFSGI